MWQTNFHMLTSKIATTWAQILWITIQNRNFCVTILVYFITIYPCLLKCWSDYSQNLSSGWWRRNKTILWNDGKIWSRGRWEKTKRNRGIPWDNRKRGKTFRREEVRETRRDRGRSWRFIIIMDLEGKVTKHTGVQPVGEYLQDLEDVFKENKEEDEIISKNEWQEE